MLLDKLEGPWYFLHMSLDNKPAIFELYSPHVPIIGVLSIPHSGEILPEEFKEYLINDPVLIARDVDYGVHHLVDIEKLNQNGIAVIKSNIIRTAIDLNRSRDKCFLNWEKNSHGEKIVLKRPDKNTEEKLIQTYYAPYYEVMTAMINELKYKMKIASFIDLHSMPSTPTEYHYQQNPNQKAHRPDFCLSDDFGDTCESSFIETVKHLLEKHYSQVKINDPYIGGHITKYVTTIPEVNNIQIEIKRDIYMDESKRELIRDLSEPLKPILTDCLIQTFTKFWEKYKN